MSNAGVLPSLGVSTSVARIVYVPFGTPSNVYVHPAVFVPTTVPVGHCS